MIRVIEHNTCGENRVWEKVSPVGWQRGPWTIIRLEGNRWLACGPDRFEADRHPMFRISRSMQEASWLIDEWEEEN